MKLNNSTEIISVEMINIDDGKESTLFERPRSRCHFDEMFRFQNYFIQLRLDWTDVKNGEPMLDADIWTEINGKKNFLKKGSWHHTKKKLNEKTGKNVYTFKFRNLILRLTTKKTMAKTFTVDACIAAASSYIASVLGGERKTQREIAEIAQVTEVTIRNRYKELVERLLFVISI